MTHKCEDDCCDMGYEFSEKTIAAIQKYEELMKEYNLGDEYAAEELVSARIETLNEHTGDCCEHSHDEEFDSPLDVFIRNLFIAANQNKELNDDDVKRISEIVIAVDEAALNDLINITKNMQESGIIKESNTADDEIESPYSK